VARAVGQELLFKVERFSIMRVLYLRKVAEQLADRGVGRARCRLAVEPHGGQLHFVRVRADRLDTERAALPDRLLRDIAADVLAANERDMLAEL
jgi:hypothetical protein